MHQQQLFVMCHAATEIQLLFSFKRFRFCLWRSCITQRPGSCLWRSCITQRPGSHKDLAPQEPGLCVAFLLVLALQWILIQSESRMTAAWLNYLMEQYCTVYNLVISHCALLLFNWCLVGVLFVYSLKKIKNKQKNFFVITWKNWRTKWVQMS